MTPARGAGAALLLAAAAAAADPGAFSRDGLDGWQLQTFRGRGATHYQLVDDHGDRVLQAQCERSASGYIWAGKIDLSRTPVLHWRWRTDALIDGADGHTKAGDDFPLRVYVVRHGGLAFWRTRSLVYVWSSGDAVGSHWPSAYTSKAQVVALRGGAQDLGSWQEERRDVRRDFAEFFGLALDEIDGVALMTDCDDTGGAARAWYGDLRFEAP